MTPTDLLLHLVATMTKQEKRYFKLNSTFYNKESGNNMLRLFEFIENNKPKNAVELTAMSRDEPFSSSLAFVKNQLTEQILDSLAAYESSKSTAYHIQHSIVHAEVLIRRGLYISAEKILARTAKKAQQAEEYLLFMEILHRRRNVLLKQVTPTFEQDIHALYELMHHTLDTIHTISTYREKMDIMQVLASRYVSKPTSDDRSRMESIISNLQVAEKLTALPFSAQLAIYSTQGTYAFLVSDAAQALEQYQSIVHLWKKHPEMIEKQPERYGKYLLNFMSSLVSMGTTEEFTTAARELRQLCTTSAISPQASLLKDLWLLELMFYLNRGLPGQCSSAIADIERHRSAGTIPSIDASSLVTLYHNCSVYYFLEGKFSRCLDYINTLQTETRNELKRDVQAFSRIFSVVAHYELGNYDILDNLIRSARRYLKKNSESGDFERVVLSGMRSVVAAVDTSEKAKAFRALYNRLLAILHADSGEPLGMTELLFWTESHLTGHPIRELFVQRMQGFSQPDPRLMFPVPAESVKNRTLANMR